MRVGRERGTERSDGQSLLARVVVWWSLSEMKTGEREGDRSGIWADLSGGERRGEEERTIALLFHRCGCGCVRRLRRSNDVTDEGRQRYMRLAVEEEDGATVLAVCNREEKEGDREGSGAGSSLTNVGRK
ncbi:hypothetical protein HAX54_046348 [Datura stramonium]|uniref:Uncharacterized protein n=1 Tax=Datura stramonium TaxID=4076 RepID=A0ABS8WGT8_DATST|nr:hypothetical protein [Datura stramonium]